jgi:ribosomal-protein-alanine N-acetyltransferase
LNLLAVAPTHQRRGIGRQLVRWLEETAFTAGTFVIRLELRTTNAQAHAFYASLGYRATGRIDGYYQGLEHATLMEHDLRICRSAQADINGST